MPRLVLPRRRSEKQDLIDHPRFERVRPLLRVMLIAFLVLRVVSTIRQIRRQVAKLRTPEPAAA
jgi:hypothetical protein